MPFNIFPICLLPSPPYLSPFFILLLSLLPSSTVPLSPPLGYYPEPSPHYLKIPDACDAMLQIGLNKQCQGERNSDVAGPDPGTKFELCKNLTNGPHHGLMVSYRKAKNGDRGWTVHIEGSTGIDFSCTVRGNRLGIQLLTDNSFYTSIQGCSDPQICNSVIKSAFVYAIETSRNNRMFLEDYPGIWKIGMDLMALGRMTNQSQLAYFSNCDYWTRNIGFEGADPIPPCGGKWPLGPDDLEKRNKTRPGHKIEFSFSINQLACNRSQIADEEDVLAKKMEDGTAPTNFYEEKKKIKERACYHEQSNESGDCHQWNSASLTICYDGLLDSSKDVDHQYKLSNVGTNNIAQLCEQKKPNGTNTTRHGFSIGACSKRTKFEEINDGKNYEILYKVIVNVSFSYTDKVYNFTKEQLVSGMINEDGTYEAWASINQPKFYLSNFTIYIGNGSSLFATVVDQNGTIHDFARRLQQMLDSDSKMEFVQIAANKHDDAFGLLGPDLIPRDDKVSSWKHSLQFFHNGLCNTMVPVIDGENTGTKLDCYKRPSNLCDQLGKEEFEKVIEDNRELARMMRECRCDFQSFPTRPPSIPPEWLEPPVPISARPWIPDRRKKRSMNSNSAQQLDRSIPGCANGSEIEAETRGLLGGHMWFSPSLEMKMKAQEGCCNQTMLKHFKQKNVKRPKRQLDKTVTRWITPIQYRFAPDEELNFFVHDLEEWKDAILNGLQHIQNVTCVRFRWNRTVDANTPHIYFQSGFRGCGTTIGFQSKYTRHAIVYAEGCFQYKIQGTASHEVLHALGIQHEHIRSDRNNTVWINQNEIYPAGLPDTEDWLDQYRREWDTDQRGLPYDFGSVMHYPAVGLIRRGFAIVAFEQAYQQSMKREGGLSFKDAKMINLVYCTSDYPHTDKDPSVKRCKKNTANWNSCKNGGYLDPMQNCEKCRCPRGYAGKQCTDLEKSEDGCGNEMELTAIEKERILEYSGTARKCIWRIRKTPPNDDKIKTGEISVEFVELGLKCAVPCEQSLEIKYQTDKTANGAHICCKFRKDNYTRMPQLTAEHNDTEVVLILHNPSAGYINFKLKYTAALPPIKEGSNCPPAKTIISETSAVQDIACEGGKICNDGTNSFVLACGYTNEIVVANGRPQPLKCDHAKEPKCREWISIKCLITDAGENYYVQDPVDGAYMRLRTHDCIAPDTFTASPSTKGK